MNSNSKASVLTGTLASLLVFFLSVPLSSAAAAGLNEPSGQGSIDWTGGFIHAGGMAFPPETAANAAQARLMAIRAAKNDAQRNLLEVAQGVRVSSGSTVREFMAESDKVTVTVTGVVKGAIVLEETVTDDGAAVVRLKAPIWGNMAEALYDHLSGRKSRRYPLRDEKAEPGRWPLLHDLVRHALLRLVGPTTARADVPQPGGTPVRPEPLPGTKTGIVLDLSDIMVKPELYPEISDQSGQPIVSPRLLDRQVAVSRGGVSYIHNIGDAVNLGRSGDDPLVMKAVNFAAGTEAGIKVQLADGMGMEAARKALKDPAQVLKSGITVAYRVTW